MPTYNYIHGTDSIGDSYLTRYGLLGLPSIIDSMMMKKKDIAFVYLPEYLGFALDEPR